MKTKTIIKNGTIFSGEIKKVKSYPASIRINGQDTVSSFLQFQIIDDRGWRCITVDPNEKGKGIIDTFVISGVDEEEGARIIGINSLSFEEYNFIIRMIEDAMSEI